MGEVLEVLLEAKNMAPELFFAMLLLVPFVDTMTTMLNEKLPLTPAEWNFVEIQLKVKITLIIYSLILPIIIWVRTHQC